jgi:hypothetical protein
VVADPGKSPVARVDMLAVVEADVASMQGKRMSLRLEDVGLAARAVSLYNYRRSSERRASSIVRSADRWSERWGGSSQPGPPSETVQVRCSAV